MQGSQEAVIHRASSFVAPRDEHHNTGPYLARSLPKHTWRHTAKHIHTHKNTDRDNNLTAKHKVEWNLTTAATRNPITSFWCFHTFVSYITTLARHDDAFPITNKFLQYYLSLLEDKETNTFSEGREGKHIQSTKACFGKCKVDINSVRHGFFSRWEQKMIHWHQSVLTHQRITNRNRWSAAQIFQPPVTVTVSWTGQQPHSKFWICRNDSSQVKFNI